MMNTSSPTQGANNLQPVPTSPTSVSSNSGSMLNATPMAMLQTKRNNENDAAAIDATSNTPLIDVEIIKPPLADAETDDSGDDRTVVTKAYPGVDDGFFSNGNAGKPSPNPNAEDVPTAPPAPAPEPVPEDGEFPNGNGDDEPDGPNRRFYPRFNPGGALSPNPAKPHQFPGFPDLEIGSNIPDLESIPDINVYQHKKTLAQGMMDLALFSANANQLRYVLESNQHPYFYPGLIMIGISLILQVAIGVGLIWNSRYNVKDEKEICIANKINNFTIIGIFLVVVINVFISAFGVVHNNNP